jgi:hypothetical protein
MESTIAMSALNGEPVIRQNDSDDMPTGFSHKTALSAHIAMIESSACQGWQNLRLGKYLGIRKKSKARGEH